MKKIAFKVLLILFTILIVESLSTIALKISLDKSQLSFQKQYEIYLFPSGQFGEEENIDSHYHTKAEIHPYLGFFSHHFSEGHLGAFFPHHPKDKKNDQDYVIAIAGGSVAANLGQTLSESPDLLNEISSWEAVKNKRVKIAILAYGGMKQPQQLIQTSLLLENYDALINLDGYNEVESPGYPRYPFEAPLHSPYLFPARGESQNEREREKERSFLQFTQSLTKVIAAFNSDHFYLKNSAFAFLIFRASQILNRYSAEQVIPVQSDPNHEEYSFFYERKLNFDFRVRKVTEVWEKSNQKMLALHQSLKKPAITFIQPILTFEKENRISEKEQKILANYDKPWKFKVREKWRSLQIAASHLQKQGLPVIDLNSEFFQSRSKDEQFIDSVHLNEPARKKLASLILSHLKRTISYQHK